MKEVFGFLVVILGLVITLAFGCARLSDAETNRAHAQAAAERARGEARAVVIEAQAESRLHSAQAAAITQSSNLPYAVLSIGVTVVLAIFTGGLVFLAWLRQTSLEFHSPGRIETRTVILLPSGMSRREFWRMISAEADEIKLLGGGQ